MRPNAAFEIIDCSGNFVCSKDHRLLQKLNLQCLYKCSSLGWPFGACHHYYTLPGTVDKAFNVYSIWKKKIFYRNGLFSRYLFCDFPHHFSVLWSVTNRAGDPLKNSRISDSSAFPMAVPFSNHNQHIGETLAWSVTLMVLKKTTEHSLLTMQPCGFDRYQSRRPFCSEKSGCLVDFHQDSFFLRWENWLENISFY